MNYSQNNEQELISNYFRGKKGTFLDIGANDGKTLSNTHYLALTGWKGVCIEPSPKAFSKLELLYRLNTDIVVHQIAIGMYDGEITLHESGSLLSENDTSLVSSIKESETTKWANIPFTPISVHCRTFDTFLSKSVYKTFDFISIDIEGMELDILPQMNFHKLKTKLICVEFNGKHKERFDQIIIPQGFRFLHQNAENLIYGK